MGSPIGSYVTAGIAKRVISPHRPHHYIKAGYLPVGNIEIVSIFFSVLSLDIFIL
jgi:hypothetical protein